MGTGRATLLGPASLRSVYWPRAKIRAETHRTRRPQHTESALEMDAGNKLGMQVGLLKAHLHACLVSW